VSPRPLQSCGTSDDNDEVMSHYQIATPYILRVLKSKRRHAASLPCLNNCSKFYNTTERFFYRCTDNDSCHGISWLMQASCTVKMQL
jgi:hypothetical protein